MNLHLQLAVVSAISIGVVAAVSIAAPILWHRFQGWNACRQEKKQALLEAPKSPEDAARLQ